MTEKLEIEKIILEKLYSSYFHNDSFYNLHEIKNEYDVKDEVFWKIVDYLSQSQLIQAVTQGANFEITANGITYCEKNSFASEELVRKNDEIRESLLEELARFYEENGSDVDCHIDILLQKMNLDPEVFEKNILFLQAKGYVEIRPGEYCNITYSGLKEVEVSRRRKNLASEFESMSTKKPQARGRAFQRLFAKILELEGWSQQEGVRTAHEEMDVIFHKDREYFLTECKWQKDRVGAGVVREFFGKLYNRAGVRGIIVSMSGFADEAEKQAVQYANTSLILFFGLEDVRSLVYGKSSFENLLNEKYQQLITETKVIYR